MIQMGQTLEETYKVLYIVYSGCLEHTVYMKCI